MKQEQHGEKPQLWGGIECTINRLNTGYKDQLIYNGHYEREDDIDAIADLGIRALRYPVLWEKHQPEKNADADFTWVSSRLERLRERGVEPIIGLVHHGSGPEYTSLLDPEFPVMLAAYAKKVAEQFPWVTMYTPVNEPLTTARFSGLYGFWYPHMQDDKAYLTMLLNQLKGVVLSMTEIRKINPSAKLVQTEDMGKTYSTPLLAYQAELENHRRFLTQDILCGKVNPQHPMWTYFTSSGIDKTELEFFIENPCAPDILGVNYYCTSERYIDESVHKYPEWSRGGNGIHNYSDVEAIRVKVDEPTGFEVLTRELWDRYKIPIAVTEAHMNCTREGQIKWFLEIYEASYNLKNTGVDVLAVTSWSLLGSFGWNKLLMSDEMHYERGAFDVSAGYRRPTAMAKVLKKVAETGSYSSPSIHNNGWWKRNNRYFDTTLHTETDATDIKASRPILIIGKTGTLGKAFSKVCTSRLLPHVLVGRDEVDICSISDIEKIIHQYHPWAIINAAGYVRVDDAESDKAACFMANTTGAELLAKASAQYGVQYMAFSSDLVFDGKKQEPYMESDSTNPLNIYGKSKADAETLIAYANPECLVIRTSAFFGPWDQYNFVHAVIRTLSDGQVFHASEEIISPTYVPHLVNVALDLLIDEEQGIWHLSNGDAISWYDLAKEVADRAGLDSYLVKKLTDKLPAQRPTYSVLHSERSKIMPALNTALDEYFSEVLIPTY